MDNVHYLNFKSSNGDVNSIRDINEKLKEFTDAKNLERYMVLGSGSNSVNIVIEFAEVSKKYDTPSIIHTQLAVASFFANLIDKQKIAVKKFYNDFSNLTLLCADIMTTYPLKGVGLDCDEKAEVIEIIYYCELNDEYDLALTFKYIE